CGKSATPTMRRSTSTMSGSGTCCSIPSSSSTGSSVGRLKADGLQRRKAPAGGQNLGGRRVGPMLVAAGHEGAPRQHLQGVGLGEQEALPRDTAQLQQGGHLLFEL